MTARKKKDTPVYKDPARPVEERVEDLLGRMTLEEKVGQMCALFLGSWSNPTDNQLLVNGSFSRRKAAQFLSQGIGHICILLRHLLPRKGVALGNAVQRYLLRETRLGIPAIIHEEALHGCMAAGSTSFPQAIALASIWDEAYLQDVARVIGRETRVRGIHQVLSPTINIARDARCGRTEETYGEDPWLTSRLAVAFVRGVQSQGVACTAKHFAANFVGDGGRDSHEVHFSERVLREIYFPAFKAAVREAGVMSIMSAYNAIDGTPCSADPWLLTDVLRNEWGFKGVVVSDYGSVSMIGRHLRGAETDAGAGRRAVEAGLDVELPHKHCFPPMIPLIRSGEMSTAAVDTAVRRVLRQKFTQGLFDRPYDDPAEAARVVLSREHRELALDAACRSIVLLRNRRNLLPLKKAGAIAVIGPNAAEGQLGGYSTTRIKVVSALQGIRRAAGKRIKVSYARGCDLTGDSRQGFARALAAAGEADVAVLVMGNTPLTEGECKDRCRLELPGVQEDLILEVAGSGTPLVVVLVGGSAVAMEKWIDKADAVLLTWYPGMEGGTALARVLFGNVNPGGKLPITFPRRTGQLPLYYNMKPSGRVYDYVDLRGEQALFPFGYGLSYTTFKYSRLSVTPKTVAPNGTVTVGVNVQNTGARKGDEVVQLYLSDLSSTMLRPLQELRRFRRITLAPGRTRRVEFTLGPEDFQCLDRHLEPVIEPGAFQVMVGGSSARGLKARFRVR